MKNDRLILIVVIGIFLFAGALFAGYILLGTDVFARELTEDQVQVIINNVVNEGITDSSERATIGRPIRVTINGVRSWRVPVTYTGNNPTRRSRLNGDITLPTRPPQEEGNMAVSITFADGTTMEVVVSPDGVIVNIKTPGVLPSPQEVNQPEPEVQTQTSSERQQPTQQPTQRQQPTQQPTQRTCFVCGAPTFRDFNTCEQHLKW